jgi:23S rRNA pseudouridine1911/1915/1917 synthase
VEFIIRSPKEKLRLDAFLVTKEIGLSRAHIQKLIEERKILVNDRPQKPSYKLKIEDKVSVDIPPPRKLEILPEAIPLDIVFEDRDLLVINKPRGLVTHPAVGNYSGTLVNALLYHCKDLKGIGGVERPGIVHRLDKDTSGLLVAAKSDLAHQSLSKQFKDRTVKKIYVALVQGVVKPDSGFIQEKIGRHPVQRKKFAVIKNSELKSREALTFFKVLKRFKEHTLVELTLKTGRTHQIRVHLSHIGHPLVGDRTYGGKSKIGELEILTLLHAQTLGFIHPRTGKYMEFSSPMPEDMREAIQSIT